MTYLKPEPTSNQSSPSSLVKKILEQGTEAALRQNWLFVSNQLKLLPQSKAKLFILEPQDWQTGFELALSMLLNADFQHKWEIAKLIPEFGSKIVPPLSKIVLDEEVDAEVRWFICQILGNFTEQKVIFTLVELLQQTNDSELIAIAGKTLIEIGDRAIEALIDLLSQPEHRLLAVKSLSYIRTANTIVPLLQIASDEDPELRAIAIKALGSFHDCRIPPVLITALTDKHSTVRKEAVIALGYRPDLCGELDLIAHLQPLLFDLNLEVCHQAAIALGRMKQDAANAILFEVLQTETTPSSLQSDLVKVLGWSEISSGISYLQQALTRAGELVTQEIITVLGRISTAKLKPQSAQVLINFWQNKKQLYSPQIRQDLVTSLGELRCKSAQPVLEQLVEDSDRKVKLHALAALKKLKAKS